MPRPKNIRSLVLWVLFIIALSVMFGVQIAGYFAGDPIGETNATIERQGTR